jgi:hypothetical protein
MIGVNTLNASKQRGKEIGILDKGLILELIGSQ